MVVNIDISLLMYVIISLCFLLYIELKLSHIW